MGSVDFNGTTTIVSAVNASAKTVGPWSAAIWAKWDGAGEGSLGHFFFADTNAFRFRLESSSSVIGVRQLGSGASASIITSAPSFVTGQWYCLIATFDGVNCHLYYGTPGDRMQEATYSTNTAIGTFTNWATTVYVGNNSGNTGTFDGRLFQPAVVDWVMDVGEMERYRIGNMPVLLARGLPRVYFTFQDGNALLDASRQNQTVSTANTTASDEMPAGVQFDWDWARGHPLRRPAAASASVTGTVARTLGDVTSTASGVSGATGSVNATLANVTSAASGASGATGTVARTLGDVTSAATGAHGVSGTVARTLADITTSAAGYQAYPLNETFDATQPYWTPSTVGGGTVAVTGGRLEMVVPALGDAARYLLADTIPTGDGEYRGSYTYTSGTNQSVAFNFRSDGTWVGTALGAQLPQNGLTLAPSVVADQVKLFSTVASTATQLGSTLSLVIGPTDTVNFHVLCSGTSVLWKAWIDGTPEPGAWQSATDSNHSARKRLQPAALNPTSTSVTGYWDNISVSDYPSVIGTVAKTLDNVTSAASGGQGTQGTVAKTLANVTSAASGSSVVGTVARSLGDITSAATGAHGVSGTVDKALANVTATTAGVALVTGTVDKTLANATVVATGGIGQVTGTVAQTLGNVTSAAVGAAGASGTVAKTLGNVTSSAAGSALVTGGVARTLQNATVAASGGSSATGTVARTLDPVVSQATGGQGVTGGVAKTLDNVTVVAAGAAASVFGSLAKTLDDVETAAPLTDEFGDPITDEFGNPILVRGAEGLHGIGGTVAVTLANVTSAATANVGTAGTLAQTLGNVTSAAAGGVGASGTVARTLDPVTSTATGASGASGTVAKTLDNTTSAATGQVTTSGSVAATLADVTSAATGTSTPPLSGVAGSVNVTLGNVTSAASGAHGVSGAVAVALANVVAAAGGSSVAGTVNATLADLVSAITGTAGLPPVTGTAAIILANVTSVAVGYPTVIGTVNRTLDNVVGDALGSSVVGSVAVTLDDVTTITIGSVTLTVYGVGRLDSIFEVRDVTSVFDTGDIYAVAGSRH